MSDASGGVLQHACAHCKARRTSWGGVTTLKEYNRRKQEEEEQQKVSKRQEEEERRRQADAARLRKTEEDRLRAVADWESARREATEAHAELDGFRDRPLPCRETGREESS